MSESAQPAVAVEAALRPNVLAITAATRTTRARDRAARSRYGSTPTRPTAGCSYGEQWFCVIEQGQRGELTATRRPDPVLVGDKKVPDAVHLSEQPQLPLTRRNELCFERGRHGLELGQRCRQVFNDLASDDVG